MDLSRLPRPPALIRETLAGLLVHCPHADTPEKKQLETKKPKVDGEKASCAWSGPHEQIERHLKDDCAFTMCVCEQCEIMVAVSRFDVHNNFDCPRRLIPCAYCAKDFFAGNVKSHEEGCDSSPHAILECICGAKIERHALDNHMETTSGHLQLLASRNRSLELKLATLKTQVELHRPCFEFKVFLLAGKSQGWDSSFNAGGMRIEVFVFKLTNWRLCYNVRDSDKAGSIFSEVTLRTTVNGTRLREMKIRSNGESFHEDTCSWVNVNRSLFLPELPVPCDGYCVINLRVETVD